MGNSISPEIEQSLLGKSTEYSDQYNAGLLYPISRQPKRDAIGINPPTKEAGLPFFGQDIWNAFELSWLNLKGKPQVAMAVFRIPVDSDNIIESKSFKLYLNSFNQTKIESQQQLQHILVRDLSATAGAPVDVTLQALDGVLDGAATMQITEPKGRCLDGLDIEVKHYHPEPALLKNQNDLIIKETLYSHLLRSNCPVTGQPDWATVEINYTGKRIDKAGLLAYIVSFRLYNDFHEQCVERMFLDISQRCQPEELTIIARYTRRGGLDINPWRSSHRPSFENRRFVRQ